MGTQTVARSALVNTLLEVKGLAKMFGGLVAVDNVSFHIEAGETLGMIGPNGAGKTTLFNLLTNELKQDAGEILLNGTEVSNLPTQERVKQGLARTYQVPRPFSGLTVAENIRVSMMPDNLWRMLAHAYDCGREHEIALSVGFREADIGKYPGELAMGDLRKLELARTLATGSKVLLLDEVFAGLTYGEIAQISKLLLEHKNNGMTFIIVSHDLRALAPLVDRVLVLCFGRTIAEGTFDEVIQQKAVQDAYLGYKQ